MTFSGKGHAVPMPAQLEEGFVTSPPRVIRATKRHPNASAKRAHETDAGIDLVTVEKVVVRPNEICTVKTGISVEIPEGHFGLLVPRSSISVKRHLMLINGVGVIDSDYRGELQSVFLNVGKSDAVLEVGERVAQLVLVPTLLAGLDFVDSLGETARGEGGFGSTGV